MSSPLDPFFRPDSPMRIHTQPVTKGRRTPSKGQPPGSTSKGETDDSIGPTQPSLTTLSVPHPQLGELLQSLVEYEESVGTTAPDDEGGNGAIAVAPLQWHRPRCQARQTDRSTVRRTVTLRRALVAYITTCLCLPLCVSLGQRFARPAAASPLLSSPGRATAAVAVSLSILLFGLTQTSHRSTSTSSSTVTECHPTGPTSRVGVGGCSCLAGGVCRSELVLLWRTMAAVLTREAQQAPTTPRWCDRLASLLLQHTQAILHSLLLAGVLEHDALEIVQPMTNAARAIVGNATSSVHPPPSPHRSTPPPDDCAALPLLDTAVPGNATPTGKGDRGAASAAAAAAAAAGKKRRQRSRQTPPKARAPTSPSGASTLAGTPSLLAVALHAEARHGPLFVYAVRYAALPAVPALAASLSARLGQPLSVDQVVAAQSFWLRRAFTDLLRYDRPRRMLRRRATELVGAIVSLVDGEEGRSSFAAALDSFLSWIAENLAEATEAARHMKPRYLNVWDTFIEWMLMDALDDVANVPSSLAYSLSWAPRSAAETMVRGAVSTALASKASAARAAGLEAGGEFAGRYYDFLQTLSPALSVGFLASTPTRAAFFDSFRGRLLDLYASLFALDLADMPIGTEGQGARVLTHRILTMVDDWLNVVEGDVKEYVRQHKGAE